jgi:protein SCO1/2
MQLFATPDSVERASPAGDSARSRSRGRPILAALIAVIAARSASAETPIFPDDPAPGLENVGVDEKLGGPLPLHLVFRDEDGREVALREFFADGRPVILTLNFYQCAMLCNLTLNGVLDAVRAVDWTAGAEYEIVTVSFAPEEGPELAAAKRNAYRSAYGRESDRFGWHFLTGDAKAIAELTDAVGFRYRRIDQGDGTYDYAHSSTIVFATPDGRISRYMNDVVFQPQDVRLALVEASSGAIGTPMEKFLLFTCYRYDPDANSYALSAVKVMRLAGAITIVAIGAGLLILKLRSPSRRIESGIATAANALAAGGRS